MPDINIDNVEYTIEINPIPTYEINLNAQGPQGLTGPQGEQGIQGIQGPTGNGISSITQTGTSGLKDTYTIYYTNGDEFNFDITNGKDGITGEAATIEVGTVSTGSAGTEATVVNVGTTSAAIFDFVIPRGQDGSAGSYVGGNGIDINGDTISTDTTIASKTDIGNGVLTVQRNGSDIGSFSANATSASTINISVPTTATEVGALPSDTVIGDGAIIYQKNGTAFATATANQTSTVTVNYTIPTQASDIGALPDTTTIGAGNTTITVNGTVAGTINANATTDSNISITTQGLPSQVGNDGKFLATKNSAAKWYNAFQAGCPDWSAGVAITINTTGWTATADGLVVVNVATNSGRIVYNNGVVVAGTYIGSNTITTAEYNTVPVCKNDKLTTNTSSSSSTFYPLRGVS